MFDLTPIKWPGHSNRWGNSGPINRSNNSRIPTITISPQCRNGRADDGIDAGGSRNDGCNDCDADRYLSSWWVADLQLGVFRILVDIDGNRPDLGKAV